MDLSRRLSMLRQVSSRNQRGKVGLKMKNVLQICLLIAICIWLLYQIKHSHDKKEAFKETNANGGGRLFDIRAFGRKDPPHIAEVEGIGGEKGDEEVKNGSMKAGHGIQQEEIEDGGGSNEELEDDDDEAVHKAREISFKEDDVSSEVAHTVQEASQASGERSFKADDASSESDDKKKKDGEIRDVPEYQKDEFGIAMTKNLSEHETDDGKEKVQETQHSESHGGTKNFNRNESNATKEENSSISHQGSSTAVNETISTRVGTPIPDITSFQNRTTVESKNEDQPLDTESTDAGELVANSTYFSKHKIYFQKNSTTVSVELVASPANLTMKLDPTNSTVSQNQTPVVHEEMNTTKMQTQREEKPNLKNKLMEQKPLKESSATNGDSLTTQEKNRDVNGDQSKISDIQNRADSSKQEAVEKYK
ncbi:uncharacterized protein LOC122036998 [Zingiber officinale]|nr:uncharacterized protein LOC122036998 [Zingiber officinale]